MRWLLLILLAGACGPPELPAFANPPDAGTDQEDAGVSDAGRD
jgi:hypothetical protein